MSRGRTGFTLLETVIAAALLFLLIGWVVFFLIAASRSLVRMDTRPDPSQTLLAGATLRALLADATQVRAAPGGQWVSFAGVDGVGSLVWHPGRAQLLVRRPGKADVVLCRSVRSFSVRVLRPALLAVNLELGNGPSPDQVCDHIFLAGAAQDTSASFNDPYPRTAVD